MGSRHVEKLRQAHQTVAQADFQVTPLSRGYADRYLRVDLTANDIRLLPVTQQMKDLWIGGKGFDLWLMLREINPNTRWDSPENPICMSPGPLAGTTSFPGSGKTLVTAISPSTGSVMDCNVGGFFGPLFKFCGIDALVVVGQAAEESIVVIDAVTGRISIERAPLESIDAHLVSEELTEMFADDDLDKKHVSVVSAGRAAAHSRMGVLNFSFYDWRKRTARIKQAGRGGIGRIFRDKKLKALVVRNRGINPAWTITESKVAHYTTPKTAPALRDPKDLAAIRDIIAKFEASPDNVIDMLREIQTGFGYVPRTALDEITRATLVPTGYLYHMITFFDGFDLEPNRATVIRIGGGTTSQVLGGDRVLAAFESALGIKVGETTQDGRFTLRRGSCLGACCAAPVVRIGERYFGQVRPEDVVSLLESTNGGATTARPLTESELAMIATEREAQFTRARALLAVCTGHKTPAGVKREAKPAPSAPGELILTGQVARPGPITVAAGATLRSILDEGGSMRDGRPFKAAQIGGPSGYFLSAADLDSVLDVAARTPAGSLTGPNNRLIVMDDSTCVVAILQRMVANLAEQSCGKCAPCREGLLAAKQTLDRLASGHADAEDVAFLENIAQTMKAGSACQFGVAAANPIRSAIEAFGHELNEHARAHRCCAGQCSGEAR